MEKTFEGCRVIELASVLAGPSVGMFLAELGAEVIKVENRRTRGDVTRSWKLPSESPEEDRSAYFCAVNWGKKSIALDLGEEEDREFLYQLIPSTDVVLSSFIPGKASGLGVSSEQLRAINPGLICGEINGYGAGVEKAAFDAIIQAEAGFTYMNGLGEDIFKMPVALMDVLAAHQLKEAILLAYIHKLRTGQGKIVQVSLLESGLSALVNQATNWLVAGKIPQPRGSDHPNIVPYGSIFYTKDQKGLILAVGNDGQFERLCQILGIEIEDVWKTNPGRVRHREAVKEAIAEKISLKNRDEWLQGFVEQAIPAGAIRSMQEVFELPQARQMLYSSEGQKGVRSVAFLPQTSSRLLPPPRYNEHEQEIRDLIGQK